MFHKVSREFAMASDVARAATALTVIVARGCGRQRSEAFGHSGIGCGF